MSESHDIPSANRAIREAASELRRAGRVGRARNPTDAAREFEEADPEALPYCGQCTYGWIVENGRARRCPCSRRTSIIARQESIDRLLQRHRASGLSRKLSKVTDHTFLIRPAQENIKPALDQYIRDLGAGKRYGLFIYGPTNVGKTFAAAYVVNTVRHLRLMNAALVNFSRSLSALQGTFGNEEEHQALLRILFHTPLLVIDDLGMEYRAGDRPELSWAVSKFYEIIDFRREEELPTIITSNRTPEELRERLGAAILTRIQALTHRLDIGPVAGIPEDPWGG